MPEDRTRFAADDRCDAQALRRDQLIEQLRAQMIERRVPGLQLVEIHAGIPEAPLSIGVRTGDRPVLATTMFEAASLGKPILAFMILRLVQDGTLALDDSLWSMAPIVGAEDPELRTVTVAQALAHASGLGSGLYLGPGTRLLARPGARWHYSDAAYFWLQGALEQRMGKSLDELADDLVFGPLAMRATRFSWRGDMRDRTAVGHDKFGTAQPKWQPSQAIAPSSLHTTASDYAVFLAELLRLNRSNDAADRQFAQRLFSPHIGAPNGLAWSLCCGLATDPDGSTRAFHWGANPHFRAFFVLDPARGAGAVMLGNATRALELADMISARTTGGTTQSFRFPLVHPAA